MEKKKSRVPIKSQWDDIERTVARITDMLWRTVPTMTLVVVFTAYSLQYQSCLIHHRHIADFGTAAKAHAMSLRKDRR
jgi:hypothetical protein